MSGLAYGHTQPDAPSFNVDHGRWPIRVWRVRFFLPFPFAPLIGFAYAPIS